MTKIWDPYAEVQETIMPNGLHLYCAHWDRPWIRMGFLVHSGDREEPEGKYWLAHFVEHCLGNNIPTYSKEEVEDFFENTGGEINFGETRYLDTRYYIYIPAEKSIVDKSLDMLGKMLFQARIVKNIIQEKEAMIREFVEYTPPPDLLDIKIKGMKNLYSNHRLGRYGGFDDCRESFFSITQKDLQNFFDIHYTPSNLSIMVAGNISMEELYSSIERSPFSVIKAGERNHIWDKIETILPPSINFQHFSLSKNFSLPSDKTSYESHAIIPGNISDATLDILKKILNKIFFRELREKRGWTYSFTVEPTNYQDLYGFYIGGNIPENAIGEIHEVVNQCLAIAKCDESLFKKIHRIRFEKRKLFDCTGADFVLYSLNDLAELGKIESREEYFNKILSVKFEDIQKVFEFLEPEYRWTLLLGP